MKRLLDIGAFALAVVLMALPFAHFRYGMSHEHPSHSTHAGHYETTALGGSNSYDARAQYRLGHSAWPTHVYSADAYPADAYPVVASSQNQTTTTTRP